MSASRYRSLEDPESLRQLVQNLREAIYISNDRGEILDGNPAFIKLIGAHSLEQLRNLTAADLLVDPALRDREMALLEREGALREFELQIRTLDGRVKTVLDTSYSCKDPATGQVLYHGILVDITERKDLERQLMEQSRHDPLTGCYNRRYLDQFEQFVNATSAMWGCILIDIDHFKKYNDSYGHHAGDNVLVKMGRFLMRQIRSEEGVVRMGGDEFLVLLAGADLTGTQVVMKRLQKAAARQAPVAFSLGWAVREAEESLERTITRADKNLFAVRVEHRSYKKQRRRK